jgi:thiamine-phosphate pyrophosphorylase
MTAESPGLHRPPGDAEMRRLGVVPEVLLLTDRSQLPLGRSLQATVRAAVSGGVTHVVLRELDLSDEERAGLAGEFVEVGATVIAAHRWVPGCAAVHLPAVVSRLVAGAPRTSTTVGSPGAPRTSTTVGSPGAPRTSTTVEFGRSCHSAGDVRAAAAEGAAYATLGPYATTPSKPGYGPPLDPSEYSGLPIPTYALGGIRPDNAAAAVAAGATGVAVMGAVMRSPDPAATVAALREAIA